jgi:MGT family glycosyltransferase
VPLRPVAWSGCGALVERTPGRPLVYLTLGTAFATVPVLRTAIDGLARLPVDVLVATAVDLGEMPAPVRVRQWVSQAAVLPHVDLVVHHGGSGTMLGAFAAGKPQLVLPQGADQFTNADAVVETGAGARLLPAELTPHGVMTAARALLSDVDTQLAADRLAEEIAAMPSPRQVVARLPAIVEQGGDE